MAELEGPGLRLRHVTLDACLWRRHQGRTAAGDGLPLDSTMAREGAGGQDAAWTRRAGAKGGEVEHAECLLADWFSVGKSCSR